MTQLIPAATTDLTPAPPPSTAVPAQRPASGTAAPDLLAATVAARQALSGPGRSDRDAVVWLSEHIATLDRVVYPVAARHMHESPALRAQQAATHRLALLVRRLHAQIAGDGAAGSEDVQPLRSATLAALSEHSAAERDLLTRLRERQPVARADRAVREAAAARPDPAAPVHTPRTGPPAGWPTGSRPGPATSSISWTPARSTPSPCPEPHRRPERPHG